ncbi:hypothetical protein R3P38DRAFT_2803880 [Favolaschia claudopus]|uniref:MULE transposase domain-containing protein n=1 Tax=Favolaschia claudopus TaxID=2862362 RepID=A0AAV9ZRF5_9AGAR
MTDHNVVDVLDSDEEDQLPPLNTREWIEKNKKYPLHALKNLEFYCTRQLRVPKEVKGAFPDNGLSVSAFLRAVVPSKSYGLVFPAPKTCFSSEAPNMDMGQAIEHLKTKSLPPIKYVDQLKQEVRQAILDGKLSVLDARYPYIRFPFWIVMTWQWLIGLADAREEWKAAEDWVNARRGTLVAADVVARRLLTLGWNTQLVAGEQTLQFARAISDRMAVDGMMDVMVGILEKRIAAKPRLMSQIVLVQRAFMIEILKAERAEDYKELYKKVNTHLKGVVSAVKALGARKTSSGRGKGKNKISATDPEKRVESDHESDCPEHFPEHISGCWGTQAGDSLYRFTLSPYETTSLYRTIAQESGIPQRSSPENNLDLWCRAENSSPPDPRLAASCLSYTHLIPGHSERFSIILLTPEQRLLAWKYGHKKQMLMDLTFGVCALLAILMVLDDQQKGFPVGFMLFTAKKDAKAVHADYNKELLADLLQKWKEGMGKNEEGESFDVKVAATDNNTRERFGLRQNWPEVLLLLCIFHVWQAWRNGLNKYLRAIPKGPDRRSVRTRLAKFLMRLLKEIDIYEDAINAYKTELEDFKKLGRTRTAIAKTQSKAAIAFLTYLQGYLKAHEMWQSWSLAGAKKAAEIMGIPVSHVARTTNTLESFNGRLKGVYFSQYQHSGRLPRTVPACIEATVTVTVGSVVLPLFEVVTVTIEAVALKKS